MLKCQSLFEDKYQGNNDQNLYCFEYQASLKKRMEEEQMKTKCREHLHLE